MLATSIFSDAQWSGDLLSYLEQVRSFPVLSEAEEKECAENWYRNGSVSDAHRLVTSHLRLVVKVAMGFRNYGLPLMELIMEGNIGLMQAVKKFNPDLGYKLATYAVWWIKASIKDYILRLWSCMRIGTTQARRRLFFSLRKVKRRLLGYGADMSKSDVKAVAEECLTTEKEVESMEKLFLNRDVSLNERVYDDGAVELQDVIPCSSPNQEAVYLEEEESSLKREMIQDAISKLDDRHRDIFIRRKLLENPDTLERLSEEYGVSKERIRQIELHSFNKVREFIKNHKDQVLGSCSA